MTQQMPGATAPPAQAPPQAQQPQQQQRAADPITQSIMDLQRDRQRLAQMGEPSNSKLALEINDTVLPYIDESLRHCGMIGQEFLRLRAWLMQIVPEMGARLEELEAAVDGDDNDGIDDELLELLVEIIGQCQGFAKMALEQIPADGGEQAKAAKAQMDDLVAKCDQALDRLSSSDDEEDDADDSEDAPQGPSNGEASPTG